MIKRPPQRQEKKVKKTLQPKKEQKSPKLDGPEKAPKSTEFVNTDSDDPDGNK